MKEELENSAALYERYRERARTSLGKVTGEQEYTAKLLDEISVELKDSQHQLKVI